MATLGLDQAEFLFHCDALSGASLKVLRFSGRESLSQPFEFVIELLSEVRSLDIQAALAQPACLTLAGRCPKGRRYHRYVHGIMERFVQLSAGLRCSRYQATLVPTIKPLHYTRSSRIFQGQSTPEVTRAVLQGGRSAHTGIQALLQGAYEARDYCVQYQESDLAFVQRLWEEEGIFYFFEHGGEGARLILGDGNHAFDSLPQYGEVRLHDRPHLYEEGLSEFHAGSALHPGAIVLRDFRFKQPRLEMEASAETDRFTDHRMYYFPGEYVDPVMGHRLAKLRLQEQLCRGSSQLGLGTVRAMRPGCKFTLTGHLRPDCNQEYIIVQVEHEGAQALGPELAGDGKIVYQNRIECIPAPVAYRPPRRTEAPRISGVQTAVVVGPPGEEIHCDTHGRVKVQFPWDREGRLDDSSSCWIRVSQPWGGLSYGGLFLPRVGQEVLVQFLEGDPDRPVIIGRVYNGENPLPYPLPEHKTVSTFKTASSPGGGGSNELRFEDATGAEEIFLHGQRDLNTVIERDRTERFGRDTTDDVGRNRTRRVANNETIQVGGDRTAQVGGSERLRVANDHSLGVGSNQEVSIGANQTVSIAASQDVRVGANLQSLIAKSRVTQVKQNETLLVEGAQVVSIGGGQSTQVKGACKLVVANGPFAINVSSGRQTVEVEGPILIKSATQITLTCGAGSIIIEKSGNIIIKGPLVKINC